nr:unnamed protein product [Callosobruchus chinensis]
MLARETAEDHSCAGTPGFRPSGIWLVLLAMERVAPDRTSLECTRGLADILDGLQKMQVRFITVSST